MEGRYITVQRKNANSAINLAEVVRVLTVPHAPNMLTVMKWNDVQEEDLSQECPDTHPFAFLDVRTDDMCLICIVEVKRLMTL